LINAVEVKVIAGDINLNEKGLHDPSTRVTVTAKQWTIHDDYNQRTAINDIALIQLSANIPYTVNTDTVYVHPISFTDEISFPALKNFPVVGYIQKDPDSPLRMEYVNVNRIECSMHEKYENRICVALVAFERPFKVPHFYIRHYLFQG
jgi:hypothetical protein